MSLRQAPRFQAWFSHLEGREVMVMSRHDWEQANQLPEGEMGQIDLSSTPIANVARDSRIEAAVVVRTSPTEVVVEVYRYDPVDIPLPINLDRYRVWERLPPHRNLAAMSTRRPLKTTPTCEVSWTITCSPSRTLYGTATTWPIFRNTSKHWRVAAMRPHNFAVEQTAGSPSLAGGCSPRRRR